MKNRLALIAALLLGILAILAIRSYVQRVEREATARLKGSPVVAARSDLEEGEEITLEAVFPKEVPEQFIPPQAIRGSMELKQIIGRKVRVP
ncbi:MAG: SAF domain-containing protein, partial [Kiritimatiellae bacterium]|nr:SAF domain-containing protein [Kiritimatiellia bacterium]